MQIFVVPKKVYSLTIDAVAASGGRNNCGSGGNGFGGRIICTVTVEPKQTLYLYVGGKGSTIYGGYNGGGNGGSTPGGCNGGGGGGATDVRTTAGDLYSRIVVAGGGGGGGGYSYGGQSGGDYLPSYGGGANGGFGYGGAGAGGLDDGGGGAGYYGGSGGTNYQGGGGGSSYTSGTLIGTISGYHDGNGYITITFLGPSTPSPTGQPTGQPSGQPTSQPTGEPSGQPSTQPSSQPSGQPSNGLTGQPTGQPSAQPTGQPTAKPTMIPTSRPSRGPSFAPSTPPSAKPVTSAPTAVNQTLSPTRSPTATPTEDLVHYSSTVAYRSYYSAKQLALSAAKSIVYASFSYKGRFIEGPCSLWKQYVSGFLGIPSDQYYFSSMSFSLGYYGPPTSLTYNKTFTCTSKAMISNLMSSIQQQITSSASLRLQVPCGSSHSWQVFLCSDAVALCVDCDWDCSCPDSVYILNPCNSGSSCYGNHASYGVLQFTYANLLSAPRVK